MKTNGAERDVLVKVWREYASGHEDEARQRLILVWNNFMDGLASEQAGRVAVRLFERLAPVTDDPEAWTSLPAEMTVYRAGRPGVAWTVDRETVEYLAKEHGLTPIRTGTVAKTDVLAYLRREQEVVIRPEHVRTVLPPVLPPAPENPRFAGASESRRAHWGTSRLRPPEVCREGEVAALARRR